MDSRERLQEWQSQYGTPSSGGVDVVDASGKVLESKPYNAETLKAIHGENYFSGDPYARLMDNINAMSSAQAPKVGIKGDKISISAPKSFFESPIAEQYKAQLQSLKGADLKNPEVTTALDKLNQEIETNYKNELVEQTLGWSPEEYNDFQYTVQTMNATNPMKSGNKIKGVEKGGKIEMKTPEEWIEYYRQAYNTDERTDAFYKSLQASTPYEKTMALVMAGVGGTTPIYGFDSWERARQGVGAAWNQLKKLPEGVFRTISTDSNTKRVEQLARDLRLSPKSIQDFAVESQGQFDVIKDRISGKSWKDLSESEKAFVIKVGVSNENKYLRPADREMLTGSSGDVIKDVSSEDEAVSRDAIARILDGAEVEPYKEVRNNYATWRSWDRQQAEDDERLARNAIWSEASQTLGNMGGIVARFLWEAALLRSATGAAGKAVSVNNVADAIGSKLVSGLGKIGITPTSNAGRAMLKFGADLVGTVPEDILQISIDNVLTYNAEENKNLLNPEEMSENLKSNLIFMALFNGARAGFRSVRNARIGRTMAKAADLSTKINIGEVVSDVDDLTRAIRKGEKIAVENNKVVIMERGGNRKTLNAVTPEQLDMVAKTAAKQTPSVREKDTPTVKIERTTPAGTVVEEVPNYSPTTIRQGVKMKIDSTPAAVRHWHSRTLQVAMRQFRSKLAEFRRRFGDVQASDFDWVWYNTRKGLSPQEIVGTVDPTTGRTITKNMVDAMNWWSKQPFTKDLRKASRESLGLEGDFDTLGYLPHTVYDPSDLSFDEALTGQLWQKSTGKSVVNDAGDYTGFGGDIESRYRTFASNMLWDAKNSDVAAARLMEEAELEGVALAPERAKEITEGGRRINESVTESSSTKEMEDALSSDVDEIDFKKIDEDTKRQGEKSGLSKAIHDNYQEVYSGAESATVVKQSGTLRQNFDTLGNTMRNTQIMGRNGEVMSLYDWGGADLVYAPQNAIELVNRYTREGGDFRQMLVEFIESHSHRSPEYAEMVADKWLRRIANEGELTKGNVIRSLSNSMRWEAMSRLRKWLVMAKFDGPNSLNAATRKTIDRFLFNHMQMDAIKGSRKISQKITSALDVLTGARYRALFYGNIKNALLQMSELNRLFTSFKWGDVAATVRRLASDENFRARVDLYTDAVAPQTSRLDADLYENYAEIAGSMSTNQEGTTFGPLKNAKDVADSVGLAAIDKAEALKNRAMIAGLVQEADRLGLTGDEALAHIRRRFERVALASNEMGRIGLASNPLAKTALFLQNFQIRELGMHLYNIKDATDMAKSTPGKVLNASKYLTKVFGSKLATTLILARLGYSASQTMGLDPFGLLNNYNQMDEEDMEWIDKQIAGGVLTPFFSGGMTSLIADMYFMARQAYEESNQQTLSDEAEQQMGSSWGLELPKVSLDGVFGAASGFIPGNVFLNRIGQMNQMMDSGWALSSTGNKMYTAPDDPLNILLGYLFGRGATANAQQYNQTYGDNLWQTMERINPFRQYGEFDPIDTRNYSDWFKGDGNDAQQFNKGIYYFRAERDRILDAYESVIRRGYASSSEVEEAKNSMNNRLEDLYDQVERFVAAYERKNGTITPSMVKQVLSVMNTGREVLGDTPEQREERSLQAYQDAIGRYASRGLSPVGTYAGPTQSDPNRETSYQGSPQWRAAVNGYYNSGTEAVQVLKQADKVLSPLRKDIKEALSEAYDANDWDTVEAIQYNYLDKFDQVVSPIIATYGVGVLSSTDVTNQLKDMLSTGTNSRSGNLIPTEQYKKDKYGRFRSMPLETVDVKKWAQQRFSGDAYKSPTIRSDSTAAEDLAEIKRLARQGKPGRARALALSLKVRVDNQSRALGERDYAWLVEYLNNSGGM